MTQYLMLLEEKKNLLQEAYDETNIDSEDIEECLKAVAANSSRFDRIKALQLKISLLKEEGTEKEEHTQREILDLLVKVKENTFKLQKTIEEEKKITANAISDFSSVKQVASSYVRKEQGSVFVDKDFT